QQFFRHGWKQRNTVKRNLLKLGQNPDNEAFFISCGKGRQTESDGLAVNNEGIGAALRASSLANIHRRGKFKVGNQPFAIFFRKRRAGIKFAAYTVLDERFIFAGNDMNIGYTMPERFYNHFLGQLFNREQISYHRLSSWLVLGKYKQHLLHASFI